MEWALAHFHKAPGRADAGVPAPRSWRNLIRDLFDHYRPERHYMRGPGPKWRQKHGGRGLGKDPRGMRMPDA
jgi:hypothetical protein